MSSSKIFFIFVVFAFPLLAFSDPSDESCLNSLFSSLADPTSNLRNWTKPNLSSPCNGVTSYIAGAVCNNNRIYKLSLPNLSLSGSIPPLISNCTALQSLDISSNLLTGPIPPQISSLLNLAVLNLSSNHLSGPIPPELALNAYLNVIDLHSNRLLGGIPEQLGALVRLNVLDLSGNELEGPVPAALGRRFNESAFVGNENLYGFPLRDGEGRRVERRGLSVLGIVGIGLGSGVLSLVVSFTAVCVWLRVTERKRSDGGGDDGGKISHFMPEY